ncbi:MAG: uracil-DNA glycosylase [Rickettsiales bacterium]|nr:uracil-DNA glycosylase [Rickettsiales bacterium]
MTQKNIKLLEWYYNIGVTDIISNSTREYLKNYSDVNNKEHQSLKTMHKENTQLLQKNNTKSITSSRELANKCSTISELEKTVQNFEGCALKKTATNTVFSDGNRDAEIMLIGEAPGRYEDEKGIPFCGDSGQLLDKVLETIGLCRKDNIYITNAIFWRPPANRKPTDEELNICLPFVEKHIALMAPKLIIISGGVALYSLFGIPSAISKYRQKILQYTNRYLSSQIPTVVIYHPSYLLRQPMQKKLAWQDMLFIKKYLQQSIYADS